MKSAKSKLILLSFLALGIVAWSPPTNEDLVVGAYNTVTSPGGYVAVIGDSNPVSAKHSLVAGHSNSVPAATSATTSCSFVAGYNNTVEGASTTTGATSAAAIGVSNHIMAEYGWAMGYANEVSGRTSVALGYENNITAQKASALGRGLKVAQDFSTAVGTYNATMVPGDLFVVGSGSSDTVRNTALRVTSDGGVILGRAQGDISMGVYQ